MNPQVRINDTRSRVGSHASGANLVVPICRLAIYPIPQLRLRIPEAQMANPIHPQRLIENPVRFDDASDILIDVSEVNHHTRYAEGILLVAKRDAAFRGRNLLGVVMKRVPPARICDQESGFSRFSYE